MLVQRFMLGLMGVIEQLPLTHKKELLARQIPYIHHFDALYVPKSKREETISIMESVSRRMFEGRVIALRWSDNERVDVDNVKIKTYKDYPDVMEKIPKMNKAFKKKWDQIQNQRKMANERKKAKQKEESQE